MELRRNLLIAVLMTTVTTVLFGLVYPLAITAIAQFLFPAQANGQLVSQNGTLVGSRLIGQGFARPTYFHSRPSATTTPYDAANSGGSQLGPINAKLIAAVSANVAAARADNPTVPVPVDLVTASASGFDPHISPAAAEFQVPRVSRERGISEADVRQLVRLHTEGRQLGFLGEPRVNVLELNLALDRQHPLLK